MRVKLAKGKKTTDELPSIDGELAAAAAAAVAAQAAARLRREETALLEAVFAQPATVDAPVREQLTPAPAAEVAEQPAAVAPHPPTAKPAKQRVEWVDITKGTTIVLVVLLHTVNALVEANLAHGMWPIINGYVLPIRMPLFFLAGGLFASGMVGMAWPKLIRRRILPLLYLYVLWMVLVFAINNVLPMNVRNTNMANPDLLLSSIVVPSNGLWFIYGLALYALAAKALSKLPVAAQFAIAGSIAIYAEYFPVITWTWNNLAKLFVFFLLGLHARKLIFKYAAMTGPIKVALAAALYGSVFYLLNTTFLGDIAILALVLSVAGVVAGVMATSYWERFSFSTALKTLGAMTLPVYLMHDSLIKVYMIGMLKLEPFLHNVVALALTPIVIAAAAIFGSLFVHDLLQAVRMGWLFKMPESWQGAK